jgi:hypothetical protein
MGLATTTKETVIMAEPTISDPFADYLTPFEARRSLRTMARYLDKMLLDPAIKQTANFVDTILLDPPPGIRVCLKEAMARASPKDVRIIAAAATFLSELVAAAPAPRKPKAGK